MVAANDLDVRVPFIGRQAILEIISDALSRSRLVTLCGLGGIGKSRLAFEVALRHSKEAVWCALSGTNEGGVAGALLGSLHLPPDPNPLERVATALATSGELLVIDNCEHLRAEVAATVKLLLTLAPISILTTSRSRLRLANESVIEIPPFEESEALAFLVARARTLKSTFSLSASEQPLAQRVVNRLDRLPLALDLAAARLGEISLVELESSLDRLVPRNFRDNTTTEQRHRSLRSVIEWSGQLISADARNLLASISIFSDAFSQRDAAALSGLADDSPRLQNALHELREQSLIGTRRDGKYLVLAPVRSIAVTWISTIHERLQLRERMAAHMAQIATAVLEFHASGDSIRAASIIRDHHADLNSNVAWLLEHPDYMHRYSQIIFALTAVSADSSTVQIVTGYLDRAIALETQDRDLNARLLYERARIALVDCEYATVAELAYKAVAAFGQLGNRLFLAKAHNALCVSLPYLDDADAARIHGLTALSIFEMLGDTRGICVAHINLGVAAMDGDNDMVLAKEHFQSALVTSDTHSLAAQEMFASLNLAALGILTLDVELAQSNATRTQVLAAQHASLPIQTRAEQYFFYIALMQNHLIIAAAHLQASLHLIDRHYSPRCLADATDCAIELAFHAQKFAECARIKSLAQAFRTRFSPGACGALTRRAYHLGEVACQKLGLQPEETAPLDHLELLAITRTLVGDIAGRQALQ